MNNNGAKPILIKNLSGYFSGLDFEKKQGRNITLDDCGWVDGPIDILIDNNIIQSLSKSLATSNNNCQIINGSGQIATAAWIDAQTTVTKNYTINSTNYMAWQEEKAPLALAELLKEQKQSTTNEKVTSALNKNEQYKNGVLFSQHSYCFYSEESFNTHALHVDHQLNSFVAQVMATEDDFAHNKKAFQFAQNLYKNKQIANIDIFADDTFSSINAALELARQAQAHQIPYSVHCDLLSNQNSADYFSALNPNKLSQLNYIDKKSIQSLAQSQTVACLCPHSSLFFDIDYAPAKRLLDEGVPITLGTCFSIANADSTAMATAQFLAASKLKMRPEEILCASTYNACRALNLDSKYSSIQQDGPANLLLWQAQSLEEIYFNFNTLSTVIINNQIYAGNDHEQ